MDLFRFENSTPFLASRRAVFIGARETIEMPYAKFVNLSLLSDGVQFHPV